MVELQEKLESVMKIDKKRKKGLGYLSFFLPSMTIMPIFWQERDFFGSF